MINSELMTLRDTADHYGVMIDDIKRWVNDKKLNVAKISGNIFITAASIAEYDIEYTKICPNWYVLQLLLEDSKKQFLKYEITDISYTNMTDNTLYRIRAIVDFETVTKKKVKTGDLGGWIESAHNLSQFGNCWIDGHAEVYEDARVTGNAYVGDRAEIYESARIDGNAVIHEGPNIWGHCYIGGNAKIRGEANISDFAIIMGNVTVSDATHIYGHAIITDNAQVQNCAETLDFALLAQDAVVGGIDRIAGIDVINTKLVHNIQKKNTSTVGES